MNKSLLLIIAFAWLKTEAIVSEKSKLVKSNARAQLAMSLNAGVCARSFDPCALGKGHDFNKQGALSKLVHAQSVHNNGFINFKIDSQILVSGAKGL